MTAEEENREIETNLGRMRSGQAATEALAQIDDALNAMLDELDARVERAMGEGISPNLAIQILAERGAIHRLRKKLLVKARHGRAASERLGKHMTVDKPK